MFDTQKLCETLPALLENAHVPGVSIALVENARLSWQQAFGVKSSTGSAAVCIDTLFEAASLTKPLFAYLCLRFVDRGLLDLDRPLVDYLDRATIERELTGHPLDLTGFRRDWFAQITARQVLSHSSGMPHTERGEPLPLFFTPGSHFKYSATGYVFLQRVIEQLEASPLEQIAEQEVFCPLGMHHSALVWRPQFAADAADGHDLRSRPEAMRRYTRANAAASLYTTAGDYGRFIAALLGGKGISASSRKALCSPQVKIRQDESWGLGFGISHHTTGDALWQWGDYRIFQNLVIAWPQQDAALIYLSNSNNGLGMRDAIVRSLMGPQFRTSSILSGYPNYDAPSVRFAWRALEESIESAMQQLASRNNHNQPLDGAVLCELARQLQADKRLEDAVTVGELNVAANPAQPASYACLADAYQQRGKRGDQAQALAHYRQVVDMISSGSQGDPRFLGQLKRQAQAAILTLTPGKPGPA